MQENTVTVEQVLRGVLKARVYDVAKETPLEIAPRLSARMENRISLKREDLQPVFSFKIRGAYNKMVHMSDEALAGGVICSSAGNHAQGVALAARTLRCEATIVMPSTTPRIKVDAVRALGGNVILHGESYDEAQTHAKELAEKGHLAFVHPYDDPDVIAGQGTIGMEILRQHRGNPFAVFLPIGGGGLIAGVGAYIKSLYPAVKIIGVEPDDAASMKASLEAGHPVQLEHVGLFADGVAVKKVGALTFPLCREVVDDIVTVGTDAICAAIKDVYEDTRCVLEPAGALAVAGCKRYIERSGERDRDLVVITGGANMNFDRLRHVAERAEIGEHREALFAVTIPETPGSFRRFCSLLGDRSITEFNYRMSGTEDAHVFVGIQIEDLDARHALAACLNDAGLKAWDLSDSEVAKLHLRHLVGGRSPDSGGERLFRFTFPERPGALVRFLNALPVNASISLFHYRNHGADIGRVLVGLQVPEGQDADVARFIDTLGFDVVEETGNEALALFL